MEYWNSNKQLIGQVFNHSEIWTYVTKESEVLEFCVQNLNQMPLILEYNITMNLYNNDHSRVADKEHLSMYEQDINEMEKLTKKLEDENSAVFRRS